MYKRNHFITDSCYLKKDLFLAKKPISPKSFSS